MKYILYAMILAGQIQCVRRISDTISAIKVLKTKRESMGEKLFMDDLLLLVYDFFALLVSFFCGTVAWVVVTRYVD